MERRYDVQLDGGSGSCRLDTADRADVRVREGGSGSVRVLSRLERTRRGDDDEGTWETLDYDNANHKIELIVEDVGSGDVEVL